jgi:hypothetical protein
MTLRCVAVRVLRQYDKSNRTIDFVVGASVVSYRGHLVSGARRKGMKPQRSRSTCMLTDAQTSLDLSVVLTIIC